MNTEELLEQARAQRRESMRASRERMRELLRIQAQTIDELKEDVAYWKAQSEMWHDEANRFSDELSAEIAYNSGWRPY